MPENELPVILLTSQADPNPYDKHRQIGQMLLQVFSVFRRSITNRLIQLNPAIQESRSVALGSIKRHLGPARSFKFPPETLIRNA